MGRFEVAGAAPGLSLARTGIMYAERCVMESAQLETQVLRERLVDARGSSASVVIANVDIRSFSAFSKEVESIDVGYYVKRVYLSIIGGWLGDPSMGDIIQ